MRCRVSFALVVVLLVVAVAPFRFVWAQEPDAYADDQVTMRYRDGFGSANRLPVSDEAIAYPPAPPAHEAESGSIAQGLSGLPVVPIIGPRAREIFEVGQTLGNDPHVFTQVGDCNTESQAFMVPFGAGAYHLGPYQNLQAAIDFFSVSSGGSFWHKGVTTSAGLTSLVVVDPSFANPAVCASGKSTLECEYERSRPSVALIGLGLYDVYWLTHAQYEASMRQIIETSMEYGVIPVLTTFPTHPGDVSSGPNDSATRNQNRALFNQTVVNLGREYGVPVMNLWRATQALPWHGFVPGDYQHLLEPRHPEFYVSFGGEELQFGFTMWNLVALRTLDALRVYALGG